MDRVIGKHPISNPGVQQAEELLLTQPAVTQQIKALEEECGVLLFDRSGGRIALTSGGQTLLPYAEHLKTLSDEAVAAVAKTSGENAGNLAIGTSQTIGQYLLPNLIAGFLREKPRMMVTTMSGNSDEMLDTLAAHRIQLALIEGPAFRKDVHFEPFMEDHMVLVVPASHEWADNDIEIEMLRKAPLLMWEYGSGSRRIVENALTEAGLKRKELRTTMELDSTEGFLSTVEAGLGVTFVSRWAVRNQLTLGTLRLAQSLIRRRVCCARRLHLAWKTVTATRYSTGVHRSNPARMRSRNVLRDCSSAVLPPSMWMNMPQCCCA